MASENYVWQPGALMSTSLNKENSCQGGLVLAWVNKRPLLKVVHNGKTEMKMLVLMQYLLCMCPVLET